MKRRLFVCFLALTMLLSLTACGASSKTAASVDSSANDHPAESPAVTEEKGYFDADTNGYDDEGRDSGGGVLENQKIIYTGDINLETTEFDEAVKALASLAEAKGGYLESSTVGGGSRGYRWADYTVRVPSAQFQSFLDQAGELAHVTWRNTNLENITETYYDTAGRLKTQQIKLERLQKLLSQAENMEDIITIEFAISETEWNIEDLSGTLRHYDGGKLPQAGGDFVFYTALSIQTLCQLRAVDLGKCADHAVGDGDGQDRVVREKVAGGYQAVRPFFDVAKFIPGAGDITDNRTH